MLSKDLFSYVRCEMLAFELKHYFSQINSQRYGWSEDRNQVCKIGIIQLEDENLEAQRCILSLIKPRSTIGHDCSTQSSNFGPLLKTLSGSYFFLSSTRRGKLTPKTMFPLTPIPGNIRCLHGA
jgi:hypothetical protein